MTTNAVVSQVLEVVVEQVLAAGMDRIREDLKPERVQEWLAAHPEWSLDGAMSMLRRIRVFPSESAAAHFASFVSGLASSMSLPVLLKVIGNAVHISLNPQQGPEQAPLTEHTLTLAGHIG